MRRLPVFILVVTLTGVAGCANVPTGGRVSSGRPAERAESVDDPYVRLVPAHPARNWEPVQIITGFLRASASFDDEHQVAREYTVGPSAAWAPDPRPTVIVDQSRRDPQVLTQTGGQATVQVTSDQLGKITPDGQYQADDQKNIMLEFKLVKNAQGQWRISQMPPELAGGLLLGKNDVDRAFRTLNPYFYAPDRMVLVPNPIFLPLGDRSGLAERLVEALLRGPTSWLKPAVQTAFPAGTHLLDRVSITDGVANVNLSKEAARAGSSEADMSAQLVWTLQQLREVNGVRLQIDGRTLTPGGVGTVQTTKDWGAKNLDTAGADQRTEEAYLNGVDGHVSALDSDYRAQRVEGIRAVRLRRPAISLDKAGVAGLNDRGDQVLAGSLNGAPDPIRVVLRTKRPGGHFTPPSFDRYGRLWTVESAGGHSWLWTMDRGHAPVRAANWGLPGYDVVALRVARDGVRVAAVAKTDGRTQIQIGLVAQPPGKAVTAEYFLPITSELVDAIDLAWSSSGTLVTLGKTRDAPQILPYSLPVSGGSLVQLTSIGLGDPASIAAEPNAPVLIGSKVSKENSICRQNNFRDRFSEWRCSIKGADPAYPG